MSKTLTEQNFWQILELFASDDCDLESEELSELLYLIVEGTEDQKTEAKEALIKLVRSYLPDFAED